MTVLLTVKNIFATKLIGIVPWSCVAVTNSTGQELYADIETPKGHRYKLAVKSSYSAPPLGALTLFDGTDPKNPSELVHGQNQDATWYRLTEYIIAKEGGSSAAEAAKVAAVIPEHLQVTAAARAPDDVEIPLPPMVYFVAGRGEFYRNGPALVTRRNENGTLNITVFADGSDPFYQQNVQPRSDELRNHCYVEYMAPAALVDAAVKMMNSDVIEETEFDALGAKPQEQWTREQIEAMKRRARPMVTGDGGGKMVLPDGLQSWPAHPALEAALPKRAPETPTPQPDADLTLEEMERLTAPDPAPQA